MKTTVFVSVTFPLCSPVRYNTDHMHILKYSLYKASKTTLGWRIHGCEVSSMGQNNIAVQGDGFQQLVTCYTLKYIVMHDADLGLGSNPHRDNFLKAFYSSLYLYTDNRGSNKLEG